VAGLRPGPVLGVVLAGVAWGVNRRRNSSRGESPQSTDEPSVRSQPVSPPDPRTPAADPRGKADAPPFHEMAYALAQMDLFFRSGEDLRVPGPDRARFDSALHALQAQWDEVPQEYQQQYLSMPHTWSAIQQRWTSLTAEQRQLVRENWLPPVPYRHTENAVPRPAPSPSHPPAGRAPGPTRKSKVVGPGEGWHQDPADRTVEEWARYNAFVQVAFSKLQSGHLDRMGWIRGMH